MGDTTYNVNVSKSQFSGNAAVIRIRNGAYSDESDNNAEILRELQRIREQLETTEPMIADTLADLEKAVQANDKPTIGKLLGRFSSGTAQSVIAGVASKAFLAWIGIK